MNNKTKKMVNPYFDDEKISEKSHKDEVMEEFKGLNEVVMKMTKGNGKIYAKPMMDDEAESIFEGNISDSSFYLTFRYAVADEKGIKHWYRNKFMCISYNETFPVWALDIKDDSATPQRFDEKKTFHNYIKEIVNKESFIRSLRRAMYGKVSIEDEDL